MEKILRQIAFYREERGEISQLSHNINNTDDIKATLNFICDFYNKKVYDTNIVANRIIEIDNLNQRLVNGDISLINEIARALQRNDNNRPFTESQLVIATRFCSIYNPDAFPIYDPLIVRLMIGIVNSENLNDKIYLKEIHNDATHLQALYSQTIRFLNLQTDKFRECFDKLTLIVCKWIVQNTDAQSFNNIAILGTKCLVSLILSNLGINEQSLQAQIDEQLEQSLSPYIERLWNRIERRVNQAH